jgi:UDP-N-acetylmuramate dehydrogenase
MDYNGSVKYLDRDQIRFGYRSSSLQRYIILAARLKFTKAPLEKIARVKQRCLRRRSLTQDNSWPNAGCIFKNPSGQVAGRLIELCGLKGKSSGGALVSLRHANFILNRKNASSSDVLKLISIIKRTVKSNFNVSLQPEIRIWR